MIEKTLNVMNRAGLHTRPAALLVKAAAAFSSEIYLIKDGFHVNAKSIIGVMTLAAERGSSVILRVEGEDEVRASEVISELFASGFGEE